MLTPSERFELINRTLRKHQLEKMTHHLCKMANVSKSGYYWWLAAEQARQLREEADEQDLLLIREHFEKRNGKVGALVLKMCLEHKSGVIMNHKKIRRIMRKYGLVAKIRQANPYRKLAKATQEHRHSLITLNVSLTRASRRKSFSQTSHTCTMVRGNARICPV